MTGLVATRRRVLLWSSAAAVAVALPFGRFPGFGIDAALAADLGAGDVGILNYAYALEQLEAAFYNKVLDDPYEGMSGAERELLDDIRDHEDDHVDFLRGALGSKAIPELEVDFSAVDFSSRKSVLTTAQTFEDLGVSAYNGAGRLLKDPAHLLAAGRIVSVEARHAAAIRDVINPLSVAFAGPDVVNRNGLDVVNPPAKVLAAAGPFIKTAVTAKQL